jgi:hypothetical protein
MRFVPAILSLAIGVACSAPPSLPSTPTIQAAGTQFAPTVSAGQTQVVATLGAAQTQVVTTIAAVQTQIPATLSAVQTQAVSKAVSAQTQVAPTIAAAQTQTAPTVQAAGAMISSAAPSVAQTRQAAATALAPTAHAVAAQVAPTVQAAATQSVASVATSIAQSPVQITAVAVAGQNTTVTLHNSSPTQMTLNNWTLLLGAAFYVGLTSITVGAGQDMTLHFATGIDTPMDTYLGLGTSVVSVALNPGTRVVLVAPGNQIASLYTIS